MLPPKRLAIFFVFAGMLYAAFMVPWLPIEESYAKLYRGTCNVVFARFWFWSDGGVRFLNIKTLKPGDLPPGAPTFYASRMRDTLMELRSRRAPGSIGFLRTSSRYIGYSPTVLVLALVLATPLPWRRRSWALLWSFLAVNAFILFRITLTLAAKGFGADKNYALFELGSLARGALTSAENIISDNPTVSYVVPALIWFIFAFRQVLWPKTTPEATASQETSA